MSDEPIKPCPVCGGSGRSVMRNRFSIDTFVCCVSQDCPLSLPFPVEEWNRLSNAAALLRAAEQLDRIGVFIQWVGLEVHIRYSSGSRQHGTFAGDVIALAREVEA